MMLRETVLFCTRRDSLSSFPLNPATVCHCILSGLSASRLAGSLICLKKKPTVQAGCHLFRATLREMKRMGLSPRII